MSSLILPGCTLALAGATVGHNYMTNRNAHYPQSSGNPPIWPFIIRYDTDRPTPEQIMEMLKVLEQLLKRKVWMR